ncbi:MAG: heme-binding protein [Betaproteobacteria bacterium]|nr:heme-binding protein [Betaproteobacteria bacterium]
MKKLIAIAAVLLCTAPAVALAQPYGAPITLDQARKAYAAGEAEARKNKWSVAIAMLDSGCNLVLMQKMDNTQIAAPMVAQDKAWAACGYRRNTKVLQDALAKGAEGWRYLQFHRMVAADGGLPIIVDGKIIGAIGVSGVAGHQDAEVAKAGAEALQ